MPVLDALEGRSKARHAGVVGRPMAQAWNLSWSNFSLTRWSRILLGPLAALAKQTPGRNLGLLLVRKLDGTDGRL